MRADRLLWILLSLQTEGQLTARVLAGRFEVSERTIYRDVDALAVAGVPIYTQTGTNGGIFLDEKYRTSLTGLSAAELRALFLTTHSQPLNDLGLEQAFKGTRAKLFATLPSAHQADIQRFRQRFYIDTERWFDYSSTPAILAELQRAVWEGIKVEATYSNYEGITRTQLLDPYALVAKANMWYLIGRVANGSYRTYRVARISALSCTDVAFERAMAFDLVAHWKETSQRFITMREATFPFYPALLRLAPEAFVTLRDYVPERYEQVGEADDSGWLTLRVLFLSLHEARMHVLGLEPQVFVVEPAELHDAVLNTVQAIVARAQFSNK